MKIAHVTAAAPLPGLTREQWGEWRAAEDARMRAEVVRQIAEFMLGMCEIALRDADDELLH